MQKHRFIRIATFTTALVATVPLTTGSAAASGPYGNASEAERLGCQSDGYRTIQSWDLRRGGERRPGIGATQILNRPSPSDNSDVRVCAMTKHGSRTYGDRYFTKVMVGSEDKGGGDRVWYYYDEGRYPTFAGGRAITPGNGRCAVVRGIMVVNGKKFAVTVTQNNVPDDKFCN